MIHHLVSFQNPSLEMIVITRNKGGGLFIYFKDDIFVERVTDLENVTDETIWIKVRARGHAFLLCNTYRPEWTDNDCNRDGLPG